MRQRSDIDIQSKSLGKSHGSSSGNTLRIIEVVVLVVAVGALIYFGSRIVAMESVTQHVATSVDELAAAIRSTNQRVDSLVASKEASDKDRAQSVEEYRQLREELGRTLDALEHYQKGAANAAR